MAKHSELWMDYTFLNSWIVYIHSGQTGQFFFDNKKGTRGSLEVTLSSFAYGRLCGLITCLPKLAQQLS